MLYEVITVAVVVNGVGGSTDTANLTITIIDDTPEAVDDGSNSYVNPLQVVTEDGATDADVNTVQVVSGNVLTNDQVGADMPGSFVSWDSSLVGTYGTLVSTGSGGYTYTLNNSAAVVQALNDGDIKSYNFV